MEVKTLKCRLVLITLLCSLGSAAFGWSGSYISDRNCSDLSEELLFSAAQRIDTILEKQGITKDHVGGIGASIVDVPLNSTGPCVTTKVVSSLYRVETETEFQQFSVEMVYNRRNDSFQNALRLGEILAKAYCLSATRVSPWILGDSYSVTANFSCKNH